MKKNIEKFLSYGVLNWLIIPNLLLCLCVGFLGTLVINSFNIEINTIEKNLNNLYTIKTLGLFFFLFGFFVNKFLNPKKLKNYLEVFSILFLFLEILYLFQFSSRNFKIDYLFNIHFVYSLVILNSFIIGQFLASLSSIRLWSFLAGVLFFAFSVFYNNNQANIQMDSYLIPFLSILLLEIILNSIISIFLNPKSKVNIHSPFAHHLQITSLFYYSGIVLLLYHLFLYYTNISGNFTLMTIGASSAIMVFHILIYNGFLKNNLRYRFLLIRIIFFANVVFTMHLTNLEKYAYIFLFLDVSTLVLSKPDIIEYKKIGISFLSLFCILFLTYVLQDYNKRLEIYYSALFLLAILFWLHYLSQKHLNNLNKVMVIVLCSGVFFFYYIGIPKESWKPNVKTNEINPIPFLFTKVKFDNKNFIYYNSSLPFKNYTTYPKKNELKNKILVMELSINPETQLEYIYHLNKYGIPFLIFQQITYPSIHSIKDVKIIEYPLFKLYVSKSLIQNNPDFRVKKLTGFQREYKFLSQKVKGKDILSIIDTLNEIETNNYNPELNKKLFNYKKIYYESYKRYTEFFYKNNNYFKTIYIADITLRLRIYEKEFLDLVYNSLLKITPEQKHIFVMNILINYKDYKEQILKRLYPLLVISGDYGEAISKIDELIDIYQSKGHDSEIENLKAEKARIFLQNSQIQLAGEIIQYEIQKKPASFLWNKLKDDLNYHRNKLQQKIQQNQRPNMQQLLEQNEEKE